MAGFDLYFLFVENIFGSFILATIGMLALFILFGMGSRMSTTLLIALCSLFLAASMIGWGGLGAVLLITIVGVYYFTSSLIKWIGGLGA